MHVRNRVALVAATALTCVGLVGGSPATAASPEVAETPAKTTVVASGLDGPRQLNMTDGSFYVAESDAGRVTRIRKSDGVKRVVVEDVPIAQGVAPIDGKIYVAAGEAEPDDNPGVTGAKLYVAKPSRKAKVFADPLAFELKYNPDQQDQFDDQGVALDAISNPYYLINRKGPGLMLMAGAGGNDVLGVSSKGKLSTFFVPPSITTGVCADIPNNSAAGNSCDTVPTGIAYGPDGNLYISGLSGLVPDEARVYVVNRDGKLLKTHVGLSNAAGVAVGPDGSVYVADLLQGAPPELDAAKVASSPALAARALAKAAKKEPEPFDPSTIGQIVKIAPNGTRTFAQVPMPSGLLFTDGTLYASTWAVAGPGAGQVVSVDQSSFVSQCGKGAKC